MLHDRVVHAYVEALADERLRERDVRALAQIVGLHLEAQAEYGDGPYVGRDDPVHDRVDRGDI